MFLEISQNLATGKHMCQSLFFNRVADLKKEALAQVFSCEFCEISKNIFSYRTPLAAASIFNRNECISCHGAIVPSWVRNVFSWVFSGSNIFSRGFLVGPTFFLVGISWVQNFSMCIFRGSKISWLSINFCKKQKETYGWGILTESFK